MVTGVARAEPDVSSAELASAYADLNRTDRRLQLTLLAAGAHSMLDGAILSAFSSHDHAYQVAGGVTLLFGAADLAAGIAGYLAARREAVDLRLRASTSSTLAREDLLKLADKKAVVFAVNLGLDAGFAFAGLTAVAASRLGLEDGHHGDRWLAGGVATLVQGVIAGTVDAIGVAASKRAHRRALAVRP